MLDYDGFGIDLNSRMLESVAKKIFGEDMR